MPENLNFNNGYKTFTLNNDPNTTISFCPTDMGIIERIDKAKQTIESYAKSIENIELKTDGTSQNGAEMSKVLEFGNVIKEQIDYIFNASVSSAVFGNQSPMAMAGGSPVYINFINCVLPTIKKYVEKEAKVSAKKMSKYTEVVK